MSREGIELVDIQYQAQPSRACGSFIFMIDPHRAAIHSAEYTVII